MDKDSADAISLSLLSTMDGLKGEIARRFPGAGFYGRIDGQRIQVTLISGRSQELNNYCTDIEENVAYPEIKFSIMEKDLNEIGG